MARLSDLKFSYRIRMQAYRYRQFDWRPGAAFRKPLSESQIALVTTAAFFRPEQKPFDESIRGGDYSFREISADTDLASLGIAHKSDAFDHRGIEADRNLALPLDRLRELMQAGQLGPLAPRHFSLMGSISAPARLLRLTAPEIAHRLSEDHTDAVLLTPV
jgi:D-proline reductase (dithiol) PrdB